jgi:hypothetical protein
MNVQHVLEGLDGGQPLGFLAGVGVLVASADAGVSARLAWPRSAGRAAVLETDEGQELLLNRLARDPLLPVPAWITNRVYVKVEKNGPKLFRGLVPPVGVFRSWTHEARESKVPLAHAYLAALCTEAPSELNTSPPTSRMMEEFGIPCHGRLDANASQTHFDFTSRNVQFLDQLRQIGNVLDEKRVKMELLDGRLQSENDRRMGWDPWSSRPFALSSSAPAPIAPVLEWFAFRALALFPIAPGTRSPTTTACSGRRKSGRFVWPLWETMLTMEAVRSLLALCLSERWSTGARRARGVREVFSAALTKGADGYSGIFGTPEPALP